MNIFVGPMRLSRPSFFLIPLLLIQQIACAQFNVKDSTRKAFLIDVSAGFAQPAYQLKQRFGPFASIGMAVQYKTLNGWITGLNAAFQFNEKVREKSAINGLITSDGFLIGGDGTLYDLTYQLRSLQLDASLYRIIPGTGHNRNSGVYIGVGLGYLDHRIRYEPEDRNAPLPQLNRENRKGYDRLSGGWMIRPAIGYLFLGNNRLVNFFVRLEHVYAQTNSLRSYQYDQQGPFSEKRNDGYWAWRFGWTLPIYQKPATEYFAY